MNKLTTAILLKKLKSGRVGAALQEGDKDRAGGEMHVPGNVQ